MWKFIDFLGLCCDLYSFFLAGVVVYLLLIVLYCSLPATMKEAKLQLERMAPLNS